jgi:hypothetical protein
VMLKLDIVGKAPLHLCEMRFVFAFDVDAT